MWETMRVCVVTRFYVGMWSFPQDVFHWKKNVTKIIQKWPKVWVHKRQKGNLGWQLISRLSCGSLKIVSPIQAMHNIVWLCCSFIFSSFRQKNYFLLYAPVPASFVYFHSFQQEFYRKITVFSRIWTQIVRGEGEHSDHHDGPMFSPILTEKNP